MNGNSSKQVLLSVLGIAVLVVAVVGVSFAFFSYSKEGEKNNTLTTGSIFFDFTEGTAIKLTNQFPVTDGVGSTLTSTVEGESAVLDFKVIGYDGSGKGIDYTVTAYEGADPGVAGKTQRLRDSEIKLLMTAPTTAVNNFANPAVVGEDGDLANGVVLATGKITATSAASKQEDAYTLRMWITSDVVELVSGDDAVSNPAEHVYSSTDFENLYYALRVDVTAATSDGTAGA